MPRKMFVRRAHKNRLPLLIGIMTLIIGIPAAVFISKHPRSASATWFNDDWGYRQSVPVTNNTSTENNVYITFTLDTSDTAKFQTDCGDIRITTQNGEVLPYYIASGCSTATTDIDIFFPSFPAGSQTIFIYYGNPTVADGYSPEAFITEASDAVVGSAGSEEKGTSPIGYWKFDSNSNDLISDTTANNHFGFFGKIPARSIEKHIEIINQNYLTTSGSYAPTDNSLGLIYWDQDAYSGSVTVYFEAILNNQGTNTTTVGLHDAAGNLVSNSEVTHNTSTFDRKRSGAITLSDDTQYSVRVKTVGGTNGRVTAARLIIVQTDPTLITATETQVFLGQNSSIATNSIYTRNIPHPFFHYESPSWNPTPTINLEVTLKNDTVGETVYAALFSHNPTHPCHELDYVTGSEVSVTGTTWTRVRSGAITLKNDTQYHICYKSPGSTASVANGKLIFSQSQLSGIQSTTSYQVFNRTYQEDSDTTYTEINRHILYSPANFTGGTIASYFEALMRIYTTSTGYAHVYDANSWNPISNSEITTTYVTHLNGEMVRSDNLQSSLPSYEEMLDVAIKNSTTAITRVTTAHLIHKISEFSDGISGTKPHQVDESLCVSGQCIYLDGTDDIVSIPNRNKISLNEGLSDGFTYTFWIKASSLGENDIGQIINKGDDTYLRLSAGSTSNVANLEAKLEMDTTNATLTASDVITLNTWHYVVWTYNVSNQQMTLYVDGLPKATSNNGSGLFVADANHLIIGGPETANFHGFIDEFKLYNVIRNPDQIKTDFTFHAGTSGVTASFGPSNINLSNQLVGYWKMEEAGDTNRLDSSGNNNTLSETASDTVGQISGKFGYAADFDSADTEYLYITDAAQTGLDITGQLTVCSWINPKTITDSNIVGKFQSTPNLSYLLHLGGSGQVSFLVSGDGTNLTDVDSRNNSVAVDTWTYVCGVYDGQYLRMYINGELNGTPTPFSGNIHNGTAEFRIGDNWGSYYDGAVDEVRIYNRGLTSNEIMQLYRYAPRPVAYWKFDEAQGNAFDSSGNNITLTAVNQPSYKPGKFGNAIHMDPSSEQYYFVTTNSNLAITGDLSISAWIRPAVTTSNKQFNITGKWDLDDQSYLLSQYGDEIRMHIDDEANYVTTTAANLSVNTWYHVQAVYRSSAQTVEIYINGVKQATTTTGTIPTSISSGSGNFQIASQDSTIVGGNQDIKTAQSADDGYETENTTAITLTGNLLLDSSTNSGQRFIGGMRWPLAIPQGAIIQSAYLRLYVYGTSDDPEISLYGQAADDAAAFTTTNADISARSRTTSSVLWSDTDLFSNGANYYESPNLKSVIQEVVDRPGWDSGNYLALISMPSTSQVKTFRVRSYDSSSANAPQLVVNYNTSVPSNFYHGLIDDVKIYNYARSTDLIVQDMNGGHPAPGSPIGSAVANWKFDEGHGTTINNSGNGGSSLNGTITGGAWSNNGKFGKALSFDGADDYVEVTANPAFDFNDKSGYTICGWINPASDGENNTGKWWSKGNSYIRVDSESASSVKVSALLDLGTTDASRTTLQTIPINTWSHVCVTWTNDADDELSIYLNGRYEGSSTNGQSGPANDAAANLLIGGDTSNNFHGLIDEIAVYTTELSESQIQTLYNHTSAITLGATSTTSDGKTSDNSASREYCVPGDITTCNVPVGHWKFDENSGSSAYDSSSNSLTGTITLDKWSTGKIGGAIDVSPLSQSVDMGVASRTSGLNMTTNNFTLSGWMRLSADSTLTMPTLAFKGAGSASDFGYWLFWSNSNSYMRFSISDGTRFNCPGSAGTSNTQITNIKDGKWHHLTATVNRTSNLAQIYINGIVEQSCDISVVTGNISNTSEEFVIQNGGSGTGSYFVDNLIVYDYLRTPAQIAWDYNRGKPLAHYKFDECQGTTGYNSAPAASGLAAGMNATLNPSGSGNTAVGTCSSGTSTEMWSDGASGKFGSALGLDGTDDTATITDTANLRFNSGTQDFSLAAFVKRDSTDSVDTIISKEDADNDGYRLIINADNTVSCSVDNIDITSTITLDTNWHHLACTIDRDGIGILYIDGIKSASAPINSEVMATTATLTLGARSYSPSGTYFGGLIDDVQIFTYALTENQIRILLNQNSAISF